MKAKLSSNVRGILFLNLDDMQLMLRENESHILDEYEKFVHNATLQNLVSLKKVTIELNPKEEVELPKKKQRGKSRKIEALQIL